MGKTTNLSFKGIIHLSFSQGKSVKNQKNGE